MRIAETADVCRTYPGVPRPAVQRLLWALHRAVPYLEAGDTDAAAHHLREDLAGYRGDLADLRELGVAQIFAAIPAGRVETANTLGLLRLLARHVDTTAWVIVGDPLAGRLWARERRIPAHTVITAGRAGDAVRLHGLNPGALSIVHLDDARRGGLDDAVTALIARGARVLPPAWRPGAPTGGPAEPVLRLRSA